jgi:hypothetical protein
MKAHPCQIARRFYQPRAKDRLNDDRFELIDDYLTYPTDDGAAVLDGKVDPVLHVGGFGPNELQWRSPVVPQPV